MDPRIAYVSARRAGQLRAEHDQLARQAFAEFLADHQLGAHESVSLVGSPADALMRFAADARAPLLVCGSRRIGAVERLLGTSMGSELAASATVPVAVVPADMRLQWLV